MLEVSICVQACCAIAQRHLACTDTKVAGVTRTDEIPFGM